MKSVKLATAIILTITILLTSCQKKAGDFWVTPTSNPSPNPNPNPNPTSSKLRAYVEESTIPGFTSKDSFLLTYDSNDRLLTAISAISALGFTFNYNFTNGYSMELLTGGGGFIRDRVLLNSNLLVDTSLQYNDTQDTTTFKWIYNANKQLIEERTYYYTYSTGAVLSNRLIHIYDTQGNVIQITEYNGSGTKTSTETYTYTALNGNSFSPPISKYYPIMNTKLAATKTVVDAFTNIPISINFTYKFDNQNRLIEEVGTIPGVGAAIKKFYF